jgi:hypothetical protein
MEGSGSSSSQSQGAKIKRAAWYGVGKTATTITSRANALENNVSVYYIHNGTRNTLKYVDAPVPSGKWHELIVEFAGSRIQVLLDGYKYIDYQDAHITGSGAVGVWTKADSVTAFDDFQAEQPK